MTSLFYSHSTTLQSCRLALLSGNHTLSLLIIPRSLKSPSAPATKSRYDVLKGNTLIEYPWQHPYICSIDLYLALYVNDRQYILSYHRSLAVVGFKSTHGSQYLSMHPSWSSRMLKKWHTKTSDTGNRTPSCRDLPVKGGNVSRYTISDR